VRNILILSSIFFILQNHTVQAEYEYTINRYKTGDGLSSNCITVVFQDSKGFLWVGTDNGLNRFDGKEFKVFIFDYEEDILIFGNHIVSISEDKERNIWVEDNKGRFIKLNIEKGIYERHPYTLSNETLSKNIIITPEKIQITNSLIHGILKNTDINISEEITSFIEDKSGILWIGTRYNGLMKIWKVSPKFNSINEINKKFDLLSFNITSIYTDNDNDIWLGTGGKGLYLIDMKSGKIKNFIFDNQKHNNNNDIVNSIFNDGNRLIIGSNSGSYFLDLNSQKINKLDNQFSEEVFDIIKDKKGIYWFATNSGLYRYAGNNVDIFVKVQKGINTIIENTDQSLWLGNAEGLKYFDKERNYLISQPITDNFEAISLSDSEKGEILIGTCSGLFKLINDSLRYNIIQIKEFPTRRVSAAIKDNKGQVWITSGNGITIFDNFRILRKDINLYAGFEGNEFNNAAIYKSPSGQIYFGSRGGLYWVHPDSIEYNIHVPEIAITNIELCIKNKCNPIYLNENGAINLEYKIGMTLNISFAALEFTQPSKNKYRVFVKNYDTEWRSETHRNNVTLPIYRPGKYILKISSSNNDYFWNNKIFELHINIKTPLWSTWYAFIFYVLIIALIIQIVISIRIRYYKNLNKSLIIKSQDKSLLEAQKEELTRINKNLIDSINYATRIQSAVIPAEQKIRRLFPQSFVYFNPRDNVSGDFYWVSEVGSKVFLAAVDCTGHGVPGAFLSIIGMNLLRSIIEGQKEDDPANILKKLSLELEKTFGNEDSEDTIKDGMDMAICVIDRDKSTLQFSGAVNDLYMVRDSELVVYKGDRSPVGHSIDGEVPEYTTSSIDICENDVFFMFSDGYADQFGGPELKKFKYRRFRHMLLNIHQFPPDEQKNALNQAFQEWKGSNHQVDDVLVMGFCPKKSEEQLSM